MEIVASIVGAVLVVAGLGIAVTAKDYIGTAIVFWSLAVVLMITAGVL